MKTSGSLALGSLVFLAIAGLNSASAQLQDTSLTAAQAVGSKDHVNHDAPQDFVVCTGWHALCTDSTDCQMIGNIAYCDCNRVNETHIVATSEIQDPVAKRLTLAKCTNKRPCNVDEAPVCKAIKNGQYTVNHVKYEWVSTYSYRGWCHLLGELIACEPGKEGYIGDSSWAICDAAPCTEIWDPYDQDKPLSCQCRVEENTAFVGMNGSCTGDASGIMSSMPIWAWDFGNSTYTFPMPGYEYIQGACAPLASDPWPPQ